MTIPAPSELDMARDAKRDSKWDILYPDETMLRLQAWIRRAVAAEAAIAKIPDSLDDSSREIVRLRQQLAEAVAANGELLELAERIVSDRKVVLTLRDCETILMRLATRAMPIIARARATQPARKEGA